MQYYVLVTSALGCYKCLLINFVNPKKEISSLVKFRFACPDWYFFFFNRSIGLQTLHNVITRLITFSMLLDSTFSLVLEISTDPGVNLARWSCWVVPSSLKIDFDFHDKEEANDAIIERLWLNCGPKLMYIQISICPSKEAKHFSNWDNIVKHGYVLLSQQTTEV